MPLVRYMTPEEEVYRPLTKGFISTTGREMVIRGSRPLRDIASTLRHEIGHRKFPVDIECENVPGFKGHSFEEFFEELCANYFALKLNLKDTEARYNIRGDKDYAMKYGGLPRDIVRKLDRIARGRVGYTHREVR